MPRFNMKQQMEDLGFSDASVLLGPGIYVLGYKDEIVWVGKSTKLAGRIDDHTDERDFAFDSIYILPVASEDLSTVESFLILKLNPRYNVSSPLSLFHKAKGGLLGRYDRASRRRLTGIMGDLGINYDELFNYHEWDELGDARTAVRRPGWPIPKSRMEVVNNVITIGTAKLAIKSWRRL